MKPCVSDPQTSKGNGGTMLFAASCLSSVAPTCYSLNGVADVFVLFFEGAFLAPSENGVAAKRDNHYVIIGQACSHSEGGSDSVNIAYQCYIISEAL
jgi:hypothetical protein